MEIYISIDIEADGPIPGPNSMLSLGAAAYTAEKELLGTFSTNLLELPKAKPDPDTLAWWRTQPEAWAACRVDPVEPAVAMDVFAQWATGFEGVPVMVGHPAPFDFMFVHWYLTYFLGRSPFHHSALDSKSYAMALLNVPYGRARRRFMPQEWFDPFPHTHIAVQDAIAQGAMFCNMLQANKKIFASTPFSNVDR